MGTSHTAFHVDQPETIVVAYEGREHPLAFHEHERILDLVQDAMVRFGIEASERSLILSAPNGRQLNDHATLLEADVKPGERLILRLDLIEIIYNGGASPFDYRGDEKVAELLRQALQNFSVTTNVHMMSLYDSSNRELPDAVSVREGGVQAGDTLVLRQSIVKGG